MNYKTLGIMLDCSRNAVTNVTTLKKFIDIISDLGYNALELYMEDTLKIEGESYLGYMRGGYNREEIIAIDKYAASCGVELIPAVQTLAHFTNAVKLPEYAQFTDVNDILMIGEERTYRLIENIFATIAKTFTTKRVNIGMDEAHLVGLGRYLDKHGYTDRHALLIEHLKTVSEIANKYGLELHMWSDMFFRLSNGGNYYSRTPILSESVKKALPSNVSPVYWDYYHTDEADYDAMFEAHKLFGRDTWFAGGIWSWVGFAPLNGFSLRSMKSAVRSAERQGIQNLIFTMWGDNGKECSFFSLLPSIYAISRYANGEFDDDAIKQGFEEKYGLSFDEYCTLDLPNECNLQSDIAFATKSQLFSDPFMGAVDEQLSRLKEVSYADYARKISACSKKTGDFAYIFESEAALCRVLDLKARLGLRIRRAYKSGDITELSNIVADTKKLSTRLKKFYKAFRTLWFKENKPFGFEIQEARLGGLMLRLQSCRERLQGFIENRTPIEELSEELLRIDELTNNLYGNIISFSTL